MNNLPQRKGCDCKGTIIRKMVRILYPSAPRTDVKCCRIFVGAGLCSAPTVSDFVCAFKSITTKIANTQDNARGRKIWQRSYHDHIIRNEQEYQKIWEYIDTNPLKWEEDRFYVTHDN